MTARERAGAVWDQFTLDLIPPNDNRPPVTVQRIILAIEQAIIAAEEAKAKAEREACAMIVREIWEREYKMFAGLKEYTDAPHCIIEEIEQKIRARSEG